MLRSGLNFFLILLTTGRGLIILRPPLGRPGLFIEHGLVVLALVVGAALVVKCFLVWMRVLCE